MSEINTELGRSSTATISLDSAENGTYATINTNSASYPSATNPASMSEWYGYDHSASGSTAYSGLISSGFGTSGAEGCAQDATNPIYKNGSSSVPSAGDYLFSDSALTTPYGIRDFGYWYKYIDTTSGLSYSIYILQGGGGETVIEAVSAC